MQDDKSQFVAQLLGEFLAGAPAPGAASPSEWPSEALVQNLQKLDLTGVNLNAETLSRTLFACAVHLGRNARIDAIDRRFREKLPAEVLDQIDFQIATQILNGAEYVRWVIVMLGGWLNINDGNCHCFNHAIRHMPPRGAVIEIGSFWAFRSRCSPTFCCSTAETIRSSMSIPGPSRKRKSRSAASSTPHLNSIATIAWKPTSAMSRPFVKKRMPFTVNAFSDGFFNDWHRGSIVKNIFGKKAPLGGPISFAYIDGAHTYEAAKSDFENVDRHLLTGGFVLFDDSNPNMRFGCVQSAQEAAQNPKYRRVFSHVQGINVFLQKVRD